MNMPSSCQAGHPQFKSPKDLDVIKLQSLQGDYTESQHANIYINVI